MENCCEIGKVCKHPSVYDDQITHMFGPKVFRVHTDTPKFFIFFREVKQIPAEKGSI